MSVNVANGTVKMEENAPVNEWVVGTGGEWMKKIEFRASTSGASKALGGLLYVSDLHFNGGDLMVLRVGDGGNAGLTRGAGGELVLGVELSDEVEIEIEVVARGDSPTIYLPSFGTVRLVEDEAREIGGLRIGDVDSDGLVSVNVVCDGGRLKLNTLIGIDFSVYDNVNDQWKASPAGSVVNGALNSVVNGTGSLKDWNVALTNFTYVPNTHHHTMNKKLDSCVIRVGDLGDSGLGGLVSEETLWIEVESVNDKPEWVVPGIGWKMLPLGGKVVDDVDISYVDEDSDLMMSESVWVVDWDKGGYGGEEGGVWEGINWGVYEVVVECYNGTLVLGGGERGLYLVGGQKSGGKKLWFKGRLEDVNQGLSMLVYRGEQDFFGTDRIDFRVVDDEDVSLVSEISVPVVVRAVNDSPRWEAPVFPVVCGEDELCVIGGVGIVDPDAGEGVFDVEVSVDSGTVNLNGLEVPSGVDFFEGGDGEGDR